MISDARCNGKHSKAEHGSQQDSDNDCVTKCVAGGGKYVFIAGGKTLPDRQPGLRRPQATRRPQGRADGRDEGGHHHGLEDRNAQGESQEVEVRQLRPTGLAAAVSSATARPFLCTHAHSALIAATAALCAAGLVHMSGTRSRGRRTPRCERASDAWDKGDYVAALTTYQDLLAGPDAAAVLEPIALQTGELFRTTELTTDGANPVFSPDSRTSRSKPGPACRPARHPASADDARARRRGTRQGHHDARRRRRQLLPRWQDRRLPSRPGISRRSCGAERGRRRGECAGARAAPAGA